MIEFKNVTFSYPGRPVFKELNAQIHLGGMIWLQGENGFGKTTFLRLILDLLRPQSGEVIVPKTLRLGWGPAVDNSFFPRLSGSENLKFFLNLDLNVNRKSGMHDHDWLNDELVQRVLETKFYQMSSGMKQILILMRAMSLNPDVLLLDEPMRGLDSSHQSLLKKILKSMSLKKQTVIMTSHLPIGIDEDQIKILKLDDFKIC